MQWGGDSLVGEVIAIPDADRVVVAVPVRGAGGEVLQTVPVSMNISDLAELPRWQVVQSREGEANPGADAPKAWYVDARRNGEETRVEVRLSATAAWSSGPLPKESRTAIETNGRSAVEKFAYRLRLPRVVVVATSGVHELADR